MPLFHDESLPSFFRRLAWSPDGEHPGRLWDRDVTEPRWETGNEAPPNTIDAATTLALAVSRALRAGLSPARTLDHAEP